MSASTASLTPKRTATRQRIIEASSAEIREFGNFAPLEAALDLGIEYLRGRPPALVGSGDGR